MNKARIMDAAKWFLRLTLAAGFLAAVADRFGLWRAAEGVQPAGTIE